MLKGLRHPHSFPVGLEYPLLLIKKPNSTDYRLVQDLQEVNKWAEDINPTVLNLHTFLSTLPPGQVCSTVLDLKDMFFSLPLAANSQPLFTFEWLGPDEGYNRQLTWT